ncbi:MAG: glycosyltransferase [Chitinophagaceae bacterium]|nr:glycosyltransferase [Chitinophagaceae bacterium]
MLLLLTGTVLLVCYACLIFFYKYWWGKLPYYEPQSPSQSVQASVVIAARNEEENIPALLTALESQSYPRSLLEIIIVDDHSTDATAQKVQERSLENVKLLQLRGDASLSSKKKAIQAGIEIATGELIVATDADCIPPVNWINTLVNFYIQKQAVFIAAPVSYRSDNSFLQMFQTIDFMTLQGITAASVSANFHTMCNGANLGYKSSAFFEVNGYEGIDKVASGDDMLLMYKIWKKYPEQVFYLKSKDAIVSTQPMPTWKDFFNQRIRWASKTIYYDDKRVFWSLLLVYFTNLEFLILLIAGFSQTIYWNFALLFLFLKTAVELPFVYSVAKFYNQTRLLRYFLPCQPLHIVYVLITGLTSQFGKFEWKGRKTK